jgi:hypothetical protein
MPWVISCRTRELLFFHLIEACLTTTLLLNLRSAMATLKRVVPIVFASQGSVIRTRQRWRYFEVSMAACVTALALDGACVCSTCKWVVPIIFAPQLITCIARKITVVRKQFVACGHTAFALD